MRRRCWFCRNRRRFVAKVAWKGKWRKACPTCQVRFTQGVLKESK